MENLNFIIAFFAGVVSFLSPCILPVVPCYLSFIGGISYDELLHNRTSKWGIFKNTLFFISGFSIVFVFLGIIFSGVGSALGGASRIINMGAGAIVMALGLNYIFNFLNILNMEKKFQYWKKPGKALGAILLGMAFSAGWTPCIGPILASILFLAGTSGQGLQGTALLVVYSAGLGIPFLLSGLFFSSFQHRFERLNRHLHLIKIASGIFLFLIGLLIFFGSFTQTNVFFFTMAGHLENWRNKNPSGPKLLFFIIFLIATTVLLFTYAQRVTKSIRSQGLSLKTFFLPLRLMLIVIFISATILSYFSILDFPRYIVFWLTFQGI
jgi:cytochrome c-type biogenesis protein